MMTMGAMGGHWGGAEKPRDIKHCFLVLSRDFSQYGSCAGSFYQEQKVANIGEFKIVSSEIP